MKRLGLCLSGGGARGAYQVGVLKALEELGILQKVYAISGTSIGSVNASLLTCKSVDEMRDLWFNYPASDFNKDTSIFRTLRERKMEVVNKGIYEIKAL
jgi:NTE family protein